MGAPCGEQTRRILNALRSVSYNIIITVTPLIKAIITKPEVSSFGG